MRHSLGYDLRNMTDHQILKSVLFLLSNGTAVLIKVRKFLGVQSLKFDGKKLCWIDYYGANKCWPAVSGRPGYQSKEQQNLIDLGPLPEGKWIVKQSGYQRISPKDAIIGLGGIMGRKVGSWPGSVAAWGAHRIWLQPEEGTPTFDRKGFSIHGGWAAGSAGCIDMTSNIGDFVSMFLEYGKDMELIVEYR